MKMICFSFKGLVHPEIINNNMRVSNKWQNCHFWVNYPFKFIYISTEDLDVEWNAEYMCMLCQLLSLFGVQ